jgi:hypothetical protein
MLPEVKKIRAGIKDFLICNAIISAGCSNYGNPIKYLTAV